MNELALRVAELCPDIFEIHETHRDGALVKYITRKGDEDLIEIDPTRDLSACASFEEPLGTMNDALHGKYELELCELCYLEGRRRLIWNATATQRCLAFVATMEGKQ